MNLSHSKRASCRSARNKARVVMSLDGTLNATIWLAVIIFCLIYVLFRVDLGDEGYWILVAEESNNLIANISGLVSHPLWNLSFHSLTVYRLIGYGLTIGCGAIFGWALVGILNRAERLNDLSLPKSTKSLMYLFPGLIYLIAIETSTPHYNLYAFWSLVSMAGLIIRANIEVKELKIRAFWICAGASLSIGALGRAFVVFFALFIIAFSPQKRVRYFLTGFVSASLLLIVLSSRINNIVTDIFEQRKYYSVLSKGYTTERLITDSISSINFSLGGYVSKLLHNDVTLMLTALFALAYLIMRKYRSLVTRIWLVLLTLVSSIYWPQESRNGTVFLIILFCALLVLEKKQSLSGQNIKLGVLIFSSLVLIPIGSAFGSTAAGLMPKWGYSAGLFMTLLLFFSIWVESKSRVRQIVTLCLSLAVFSSQVSYVLVDSQHTAGSLRNQSEFTQVGNLGYFFVSPDLSRIFEESNYLSNILQQEWEHSNALLFDLSEFQPLIGLSLGFKTPLAGLTLNSMTDLDNEQRDLSWFEYVISIEKKYSRNSNEKPFIIIDESFTNCEWDRGCDINYALTGREVMLASYVQGFPSKYDYIGRIGSNFLLGNTEMRR